MRRIDNLNAWRIFQEIVAAEGLNAACERLHCEPSTASRAIRALEEELGGTLFSRSTRPVTLTELGRQALEHISPILAMHQDMIESLKGDRDRMEGLIRVASHAGIGPLEVVPALVAFREIYPDIEFELLELDSRLPEVFITDSGIQVDVVIAYRADLKVPSGITERYLGEMPFVPCASPAYIRRKGFPKVPEDCERHTGLLISTPTRNATSLLKRGGAEKTLHWQRTLTLHSQISIKSAVMLGAGIVPDLPLFHGAKEIEQKTLVPVLPGWQRAPLSCFLLAKEESYGKRRVGTFVEWMAEHERASLSSLKSRFPQFYVH